MPQGTQGTPNSAEGGRCKHRTEVYSRVVGYYRPVQQWNPGKRAEYADRVPFVVSTNPRSAIHNPQSGAR